MNIRIVLRVIVCGLILPFIGQAGGDQSAQLHSQRVFKIGVLATLTGSGFTLGQDTVAALQIAEEQLEADAISQQRHWAGADVSLGLLQKSGTHA